MKKIYSKIIGTGSHDISTDRIIANNDIPERTFYDAQKNPIQKTTSEVLKKFQEITGTKKRHYAAEYKVTSDLGIEAGKEAIRSANVNPDDVDCLIFATNFRDVATKTDKVDLVPSYAALIKNDMQIINPAVIAYDVIISGYNSARKLEMLEDCLGLGSKDLVVHIDGHRKENLFERAKYHFSKCSVDKESLNSIVVVHYFGQDSFESAPSLIEKVENELGLFNPNLLSYEIVFGCPGFLQAMIQANTMITCGKRKNILVIGAEMLSRVMDTSDVDSNLYADGGGAVFMKAVESDEPLGMLFHKVRSDTLNQQACMIWMGESYDPNHDDPKELFLKMLGTRVHKHALRHIPLMIKEALEEAKIPIEKIAKMVFHQPNPLMLEEITLRTFAQFNRPVPENIMPIIGDTYGNPSVACIPLILDRMYKGTWENHKIKSGDIILFFSIGAGMNMNIAFYKVP